MDSGRRAIGRKTSKSSAQVPQDKLQLYEKLIATIPKIERKGASMPYTSLNGNMFSFLSASGTLMLRLPAALREEFIKKHKTKLYEAHGTVLKEYVVVPDKLLANTAELEQYFDLSFHYPQTLKPKPTKRGK